tara:strand:- start:188 stop:742 length:555 start_codon:yes stop_codon:yes gene_type:complete
MSDLMNFKKSSGQPSTFSKASGRTLSGGSNPVMEARQRAKQLSGVASKPSKGELDKYPIKDDCSSVSAELAMVRSSLANARAENTNLKSKLSNLSANFTIPYGTSYVGYSGISGVSFSSAFEQAYVSGGDSFETASYNLFAKAINGKFFWGQYYFSSLTSITRGEGFFVRNLGSPILVDWSRVK